MTLDSSRQFFRVYHFQDTKVFFVERVKIQQGLHLGQLNTSIAKKIAGKLVFFSASRYTPGEQT